MDRAASIKSDHWLVTNTTQHYLMSSSIQLKAVGSIWPGAE